jgi:hypothetical protein
MLSEMLARVRTRADRPRWLPVAERLEQLMETCTQSVPTS